MTHNMPYSHTHAHSPYLIWAKSRPHLKYNLATSGVMDFPLAQLPVRLEDLEISGQTPGYGWAPLQEKLAQHTKAPKECIVAAIGTSMAIYLSYAGTLEPGDDVLVEHPAYEPMFLAAQLAGANVVRFHRRFENGFLIDPSDVERAVTPKTRLISLTNLHNPTGALTSAETLRAIGKIAERNGARVMVDEVYLPMLFDNPAPSAFQLGETFIVTSSLTKVYGLSGLRCGWILAAPDLAERIWHINDLFGNIPPHTAELMSIAALDNLAAIAQRSRNLLTTNRALLDKFLNSRNDLELFRPPAGTVIFPRLTTGNTGKFIELLREKYETEVVPGRFFEMPDHFRVGIGGDTEMTRAGLERISSALDEFARKV
jgi:aspartate/methionine/tyrosine aminotransferase